MRTTSAFHPVTARRRARQLVHTYCLAITQSCTIVKPGAPKRSVVSSVSASLARSPVTVIILATTGIVPRADMATRRRGWRGSTRGSCPSPMCGCVTGAVHPVRQQRQLLPT